jgi:hypothetical protein
MALPPALASFGSMPKGELRSIFREAFKLTGGIDRLVQEANRSSAGYWEMVKTMTRLEPKDHNINLDNSAEALLEALEASARGETVEFIQDYKTEAIDAVFSELPDKQFLWSAKVRHAKA